LHLPRKRPKPRAAAIGDAYFLIPIGLAGAKNDRFNACS